jgi:hypothetical protein
VAPETRFMTSTGRPSRSRPSACTGTTFGCSTRAIVRASAITSAPPSSASGRLTATSRSSDRWEARSTTPIPPSPSVALTRRSAFGRAELDPVGPGSDRVIDGR